MNKIKELLGINRKTLNERFIEVNKLYFKVKNHWFWDEYEKKGWEPQTYRVMQEFFTPDVTYVDIGAWLGITIFFAAEIGFRKIYAVEANPLSYGILKKNCSFNKFTENVKLSNICITDKDNIKISFGGRATSSACSIRGNDWHIESAKLGTYLKENNLLNEKLLIKIDIEGAEELIIDDLGCLSDKIIFLSLHPPFFSNVSTTANKIIDVCYNNYDVLDSSLNPIKAEELFGRITSKQEKPYWGTSFGNFFEIILKGKNV